MLKALCPVSVSKVPCRIRKSIYPVSRVHYIIARSNEWKSHTADNDIALVTCRDFSTHDTNPRRRSGLSIDSDGGREGHR